MSFAQREPIAIVGTGCRFPGGCNTASKLWDLLKDPWDASQEIPPERFNIDRFYHRSGSHHGTTNVRHSYFLREDVWQFDHKFFAIPPGEAEAIDPQQRILLEVTFEAIESAGCTLDQLNGSDTAVYVGVMTNDYLMQQSQDLDFVPKYNVTGVANSNSSSRISYFFNWHGPSMTIDTACSSSLVAVNEAVQALRSGTSRIAVAAGTNLLLNPLPYISESKLNMLSPTGRCRMWDADADGYARGEGIAAVILKTLSSAIQDGDQIECVIREIGLNHDGKTTGLTMPNPNAQADLIKKVYRDAGLDQNDKYGRCQYFEAHGTGTPVGDPLEAEALSKAFFNRDNHAEDDILFVGSIKTVIGHTEGTSGLAGLFKACLAVKHALIPPNLLFNSLNPRLKQFTSHLKIPTFLQPWPELPAGTPRRASVNSFGFGGANAHVILESYAPKSVSLTTFTYSQPSIQIRPTKLICPALKTNIEDIADLGKTASRKKAGPLIPFVFSAATPSALVQVLQSFQQYLKDNSETDPTDLSYAMVHKKSTFSFRKAFASPSLKELPIKIEDGLRLIENNGDDNFSNQSPGNSSILGIFTGQGAQWVAMGRELILSIPMAMHVADELDASLAILPEDIRPRWSLTQELLATEKSRIDQAEISQPLCTAVQIILVELLAAAGVTFAAVIGHSSGEIAAAYAAGLLSKSDAMRISYLRGCYTKLASGPGGSRGAMMAVSISLEDAKELCELEEFAGRISIAAHNSPSSVTLSGDVEAIENARTVFDAKAKFARQLKVDTAYHSHHMAPCAIPYLDALYKCKIGLRQLPKDSPLWFSSVYDGELVEPNPQLRAQYWVDNMTKPVQFFRSIEKCWERLGTNLTCTIEIGPHPALKKPVMESLENSQFATPPYSGTLSRAKNDLEAFKDTLGFLWMYGGAGAVNLRQFQKMCSTEAFKVVPELPLYPWQHDRRLWYEARSWKHIRSHDTPYHDLLGRVAADSTADRRRWRNVLSVKELPWLEGHGLQGQTVFPATGYVALAMEAAMQMSEARRVSLIELHDLEIVKAISISDTHGTELSVHMTDVSTPGPKPPKKILANFAVYSALDSMDSAPMALNCHGIVSILFEDLGPESSHLLSPRDTQPVNLSDVDVERFYSSLRDDVGYTYDGVFRNIKSLSRRLGLSTGTIKTPEFDNYETQLLFHPATADCALQGMFAASSAPGDGSITSIIIPKSCSRVTLVPSLCGPLTNGEVAFDCTLTDSRDGSKSGDIDIYSEGYGQKFLQFEGLVLVPLAPPTKIDDICLYQESIWCIDRPDGEMELGDMMPSATQRQKVLNAERAAFFYLKKMYTSVDQDKRASLPWYRQTLFARTEKVMESVRSGQREYAKDWYGDTEDQITEMMDSYGDDADFNLTRVVGEHLQEPEVLAGEVNILEYMTQNDCLGRYYREATGLEKINDSVAELVAKLTNKFPHMHFCEIGAGTGSVTRSILDFIGHAFASYTYTDISSGFFEAAREKFRMHSQKMVYKPLDIDLDPIEQAFEIHSYDCVVAANVLHATKYLDVTLQNVRRLLRPGGYLVLLELVDNDSIRIPMLMGGLPGWWVGWDDGRRDAPHIGLNQWDTILKRNGFSGIDGYTPQVDTVVQPQSIFCSMALDEDIKLLRDPLVTFPDTKSAECLVFIQGKSSTGKDLVPVLERNFEKLVIAANLDSLPEIPTNYHVLCLEDFGGSVFEEITQSRWEKLQRLLEAPQSLLWITSGGYLGNPYAAMSIGLFRNLQYELPGSHVQVLDCKDEQHIDIGLVAELLLRLQKMATLKGQGKLSEILWTMEPEMRLQNGRLEVSRVRPQEEQNARLNSSQRHITRLADVENSTLELVASGDSFIIREYAELSQVQLIHDYVSVRVSMSCLLPIKTPAGYAFAVVGVNEQTEERIFCLSSTNASRLVVHKSWTSKIMVHTIDRHYLSLAIGVFITQLTLKMIPQTGVVLVHEPNPGLASMLSKQISDHGRTVIFTSTKPDARFRREKWKYLHPRCSSRVILSAIPTGISVFVKASGDSLAQGALESRISAALPRNCEKLDLADLVGKISSPLSSTLPEKAPEGIVDLLQNVSSLVSTQLNGVPDGAILDVVPLAQIVLTPTSSISGPCLVDWLATRIVPILVEPITSRPDLFRSDKTYWLAGLSGDFGRSIADFMIAHGARHVALSSRSPKADEQWMHWHRSNDAEVYYFKCDVSDFSSVQQTFTQITSSMPAVGGVALGALVLCDRMFAQMTLDEFQRAARPKVDGAINLDRLFGENGTDALDWFICLSSVVATVGNPGQANYAAANCFMKALVNRRRERGLAGSSIDISTVLGVGFVEREMKADGRLSREQQDRLLRSSLLSVMSESDLHQAFSEAVISGRPDASVNPEIITGLAPVRRENAHDSSWTRSPRFGLLVRIGDDKIEQWDMESTQIPIKKLLEEAKSAEDMAIVLKECLTQKLRNFLFLSTSDDIPDTIPLIDIGVDSLVGVELRAWCLKELSVDIPVMKILNGISLGEIADEILCSSVVAVESK